jgi:signal transduction histidine kinase
MEPISFVILAAIIAIFAGIYWPLLLMIHVSRKTIELYNKATKLTWLAPRYAGVMVMWIVIDTILFVAIVLGLFDLPDSGDISDEMQLVIIVLLAFIVTLSHFWLVSLYTMFSNISVFITAFLIMAASLAVAIMTIFDDCNLVTIIFMFVHFALCMFVFAMSAEWLYKNPTCAKVDPRPRSVTSGSSRPLVVATATISARN